MTSTEASKGVPPSIMCSFGVGSMLESDEDELSERFIMAQVQSSPHEELRLGNVDVIDEGGLGMLETDEAITATNGHDSDGSLSFCLDGLESDDDDAPQERSLTLATIDSVAIESYPIEETNSPEGQRAKRSPQESLGLQDMASFSKSRVTQSKIKETSNNNNSSDPLPACQRLDALRNTLQKVLSQQSIHSKQEPKMTKEERILQLESSFSKLDEFNESQGNLVNEESFGTMNTSATSFGTWGSLSFVSWNCNDDDDEVSALSTWPAYDDFLKKPRQKSKSQQRRSKKKKKKKSKCKSAKATCKSDNEGSKNKSLEDANDPKSKRKKRKSKPNNKSMKTIRMTENKAVNNATGKKKKNKKKGLKNAIKAPDKNQEEGFLWWKTQFPSRLVRRRTGMKKEQRNGLLFVEMQETCRCKYQQLGKKDEDIP